MLYYVAASDNFYDTAGAIMLRVTVSLCSEIEKAGREWIEYAYTLSVHARHRSLTCG